MSDGGPQLGFDVIADQRQIFLRKALLPLEIAGNKDRYVVDKGQSGFQGTFGIKEAGLLRAHRHIVEQDLGPGLLQNADGSYSMLLSPDAPPEGWESNHVQTIPGRGWFPYMRAYGAKAEFFNDEYKFPTVNKVTDFGDWIG